MHSFLSCFAIWTGPIPPAHMAKMRLTTAAASSSTNRGESLVAPVAVRSSCPHPDSPLCLGVHYIPHLAAAVPHVPLIEQILERHQLVAVFILGVNIVVDSDVAHIIGREYLLDIKTGVQLVSSKAGKILCDDDGDVAVAHVIHHLFKGWAIEIRAGIAIVHIKSGVLEPILIGVLLQDKFLRRDLSRVFSS